MRFRLPIACMAAVCALALPAAASAAPITKVTVRSCQLGDTPKQRQATFYARMRAIAGTRQMQMRFTLVDTAGDGKPSAVKAPSLLRWRKSRKGGVSSFGYAQTVAGLASGGRYSVTVQFRWLDAQGRVIKTAKRTSRECRQQGSLPNLTASRLAARPTDTAGTVEYSFDLTNTGKGEARDVFVDLFVDGAAADTSKVAVVAPGETLRVHIGGPVCKRAVRVSIDRARAINETNDDDNVLRFKGCPALDA
jgi:hypothetical protein